MQADEHWYVQDKEAESPYLLFKSKAALVSWLKAQYPDNVSEPFEDTDGNVHVFVNKGKPFPLSFRRVKVVVNE